MTETESEILFKELEGKTLELYPFFRFGESHRSLDNGNVSSQQYEFYIGLAIRNI
jgi:hypothetical protein